MQNIHECPYCAEDLEQWRLRFQRGAHERGGERTAAYGRGVDEGRYGRQDSSGVSTGAGEAVSGGLTLLSLCSNQRCGYYVLRYRNGLTHWDRDVEAARLLRTVFGDDQ